METIINEEWRSISGYLNYRVSNIGRVRNSKTGKILKPGCVHGGYEQVNIGRSNPQKIHRLVAHEFIENPTNLTILLESTKIHILDLCGALTDSHRWGLLL